MELAGRSKFNSRSLKITELAEIRITITEVTHELFIHHASLRPKGPLILQYSQKVQRNLFMIFGRGKTQKRAKTHRPFMSALSDIFVLKENLYSVSLGQIS